MSTKRKTLKQKKESELRRSKLASDTNISVSSPVYTFSSTSATLGSIRAQKTTQLSYDLSDIRNSLLVSGLLLLANGILFVLVRNNIISLRLFGL